MEKQIVTPKRIRDAFGIESRRLTYLIERGHVVADVQDLGQRGLVRLFSPREAVKVGLVEFFGTDHGMALDRAARLAEVAVMAPEMLQAVGEGLFDKVDVEITVTNGQAAHLDLLFPTATDKRNLFMYCFNLVHNDVENVFEQAPSKRESSCNYYINNILHRLTAKLGLTVDDINAPNSWPFTVESYGSNVFSLKFKED